MISVDVSSKMLEYAKKNYPHELIEYHVGDILGEFPFPNSVFDKLFAVHVFHFIRDLRQALSGFHKILKPGGQMSFTTLTANSWIFRSLKELSESEAWHPYMKDYPKYFPELLDFSNKEDVRQRVLDLLEASEFHVVHLEVMLDTSYEFEDIETFLEIICSCNPCIDNIPKKLYQLFKYDVKKLITSYAGIPVDSKGIDFRHDYIWGIVERTENLLK
ncbi:unnamed protein product [Orchesella dallaii]|uniref:Methyltransferase type 11 domain-containing protein n=1 Tax=Orchesella dallaii TaxID=48710 RepID=A0ABP1QMN7_9HEXA